MTDNSASELTVPGIPSSYGPQGNFNAAETARRGAISPTPAIFPSYSSIDVRSGLRPGDWTLNLFLNNVTDKRGVLNSDFNSNTTLLYIHPRTVGLNLMRIF